MDLKLLRKKARMSQITLSKLSGIGRYNISLYESGHRELTKEEAVSIKSALKNGASHGIINKKK